MTQLLPGKPHGAGANHGFHPSFQFFPKSAPRALVCSLSASQDQMRQGHPVLQLRQGRVICFPRPESHDARYLTSFAAQANVTCTPSKPAPPRQRSKPRQDLQDRLARCESLLRQYVDRPESGPATGPSGLVGSTGTTGSTNSFSAPIGGQFKPQFSARTPTDGHSPVGTPGRTGTDAGPARFINAQLWQCLNDEVSGPIPSARRSLPRGTHP